jgi:hypothetical protein
MLPPLSKTSQFGKAVVMCHLRTLFMSPIGLKAPRVGS